MLQFALQKGKPPLFKKVTKKFKFLLRYCFWTKGNHSDKTFGKGKMWHLTWGQPSKIGFPDRVDQLV